MGLDSTFLLLTGLDIVFGVSCVSMWLVLIGTIVQSNCLGN